MNQVAVETLTLHKDSWTAIFAMVLHHITDHPEALQECLPVLPALALVADSRELDRLLDQVCEIHTLPASQNVG